jgi:hypothetical protein
MKEAIPQETIDKLRREEEADRRMRGLGDIVNRACNAFFVSRGMKHGGWSEAKADERERTGQKKTPAR